MKTGTIQIHIQGCACPANTYSLNTAEVAQHKLTYLRPDTQILAPENCTYVQSLLPQLPHTFTEVEILQETARSIYSLPKLVNAIWEGKRRATKKAKETGEVSSEKLQQSMARSATNQERLEALASRTDLICSECSSTTSTWWGFCGGPEADQPICRPCYRQRMQDQLNNDPNCICSLCSTSVSPCWTLVADDGEGAYRTLCNKCGKSEKTRRLNEDPRHTCANEQCGCTSSVCWYRQGQIDEEYNAATDEILDVPGGRGPSGFLCQTCHYAERAKAHNEDPEQVCPIEGCGVSTSTRWLPIQINGEDVLACEKCYSRLWAQNRNKGFNEDPDIICLACGKNTSTNRWYRAKQQKGAYICQTCRDEAFEKECKACHKTEASLRPGPAEFPRLCKNCNGVWRLFETREADGKPSCGAPCWKAAGSRCKFGNCTNHCQGRGRSSSKKTPEIPCICRGKFHGDQNVDDISEEGVEEREGTSPSA